MTDHDAFLEAICERPEDDFPRLQYADWLDERGDPRGEFIRVQCEFHASRCGYAKDTDDAYSLYCNNTLCHHCNLDHKASAMCREYGNHWATPVARALRCGDWDGDGNPDYDVPRWQWRRGFITHVTLSHDAFLEHAAALFLAAPIEAVTLSDKKPSRVSVVNFGWYCYDQSASNKAEDELGVALWTHFSAPCWRNWRLYDTAEAANADLSNACVKLGRKRAAKAREEMAKR